MTVILGVKLVNREQASLKFQEIITKYGCSIGTRIGLPPKNRECEQWGIILLEINDFSQAEKLEKELLKIDNVELQRMVFK